MPAPPDPRKVRVLARARQEIENCPPGILEFVWDAAYSAATQDAQQAQARLAERARSDVTPVLVRQAMGTQQALDAGWRWGPPVLLGLMGPGTEFTYGGCDPDKPIVERRAVTIPGEGFRFRFEDTSEEIRLRSFFWARKGGGGGDVDDPDRDAGAAR